MKKTILCSLLILFTTSFFGCAEEKSSSSQNEAENANTSLRLADQAEESLLANGCRIQKEITFRGISYEKYNVALSCPYNENNQTALEKISELLSSYVLYLTQARGASISESERNLIEAKIKIADELRGKYAARINILRIASEENKAKELAKAKKAKELADEIEVLAQQLKQKTAYEFENYFLEEHRVATIALYKDLLEMLNDPNRLNAVKGKIVEDIAFLGPRPWEQDLSDYMHGTLYFDIRETADDILKKISKQLSKDSPEAIERQKTIVSLKQRQADLAKAMNCELDFRSSHISDVKAAIDWLEGFLPKLPAELRMNSVFAPARFNVYQYRSWNNKFYFTLVYSASHESQIEFVKSNYGQKK